MKPPPPFGKDGGKRSSPLGIRRRTWRIATVVRTEAVLGGHAEGELTAFGGDAERRVVRVVQHFERIAVQRMNFRVTDLRNEREIQRRNKLHAHLPRDRSG